VSAAGSVSRPAQTLYTAVVYLVSPAASRASSTRQVASSWCPTQVSGGPVAASPGARSVLPPPELQGQRGPLHRQPQCNRIPVHTPRRPHRRRALPVHVCSGACSSPGKNLPRRCHSNSVGIRSSPGRRASRTAERTPTSTRTSHGHDPPVPVRPAPQQSGRRPSQSIAWRHSFC